MQEAQNYGQKKIRRARLSNGDELDVEVAVVALSTLRNTEWLQGANLAADAACRAFDADGVVTDDIFVVEGRGPAATIPSTTTSYSGRTLEQRRHPGRDRSS